MEWSSVADGTDFAPSGREQLTVFVSPSIFADPATLSPLPGCFDRGSPHDDPRPHLFVFHPGACGFCICPRANTCLELARTGNAARHAGASRLPGTEILPACPP